MYIAVRIFYKNIRFTDLKHLPKNKPLIIASNHSNAFMDAVVMAVLIKQPVHFLARSDVFNSPLKRWFLGKQLNLTPIYRLEEGADQLHKNEDTFEKCFRLLKRKKTIVIFPEGICVQEKRLRKLRKGAARIAFRAEEMNDFKMGLLVLPVGLNYSSPKKFRSKLLISVGKPMKVVDYATQYKTDKVRAMNVFTKDLEQAMKELLITIENKTNDQLVEDIQEVYKKQLLEEKKLSPADTKNDFHVSSEITNAVNYFQTYHPVRLADIKQKLYHYIRELDELKLRDHLLRRESIEAMNTWWFLKDYLLIFLGMPVHILGLIMNYLPYKTAYITANKVSKNVEFHSSINITIGTFAWIFYYLIQLIIIAFISASPIVVLIYSLLVPLAGLYCLWFYPAMKKIFGRWRLLSLVQQDKQKRVRLW